MTGRRFTAIIARYARVIIELRIIIARRLARYFRIQVAMAGKSSWPDTTRSLSLSLSLKLKRNNVLGHNYAHFPVTQRRDFPRDVVALGLLSFRCLMRRFRSARFVSGAPRLYQRDRRESR